MGGFDLKKLRRSKIKANFFHIFENKSNQRWEIARTIISCTNILSLSCNYPLKTIVSAVSCLTGLKVSLRRAPKNYPSDGNFLKASHINIKFVIIIL